MSFIEITQSQVVSPQLLHSNEQASPRAKKDVTEQSDGSRSGNHNGSLS